MPKKNKLSIIPQKIERALFDVQGDQVEEWLKNDLNIGNVARLLVSKLDIEGLKKTGLRMEFYIYKKAK